MRLFHISWIYTKKQLRIICIYIYIYIPLNTKNEQAKRFEVPVFTMKLIDKASELMYHLINQAHLWIFIMKIRFFPGKSIANII